MDRSNVVPEFTHDWVTHHTPIWWTHLARFADRKASALEIGCYEGRATLWFLQQVLCHPDSTIDCIDPFEPYAQTGDFGLSIEQARAHFIANTSGYRDKLTLHTRRSQDVLPQLASLGRAFDFIYVDGCHLAADETLT